jgi:hypothetical protein
MPRLLVYVVPVALAIYALIDLSRSEPSERAGIRPLGWLAIIVLLPIVGPVTWIVVSRTQGTARGEAQRRPTGPTPRTWPVRRPGPKAPDDDPDFLWRLEQQRRRGRDTGGGAASGSGPPTGGDSPPTEGDSPGDDDHPVG